MRRGPVVSGMVALLLASVLVLVGCRSSHDNASVVGGPPEGSILSAADLFVEVTGPQSDDEGHYVALAEPGSVVVTGLVSGPEPPRTIYVNGAPSTIYAVEQIEPWGMPATYAYPVYRFRAPAVLRDTDDITIVVGDPYPDVEYVYVANRPATIARWTVLAARNDPPALYRLGSANYAAANYTQAATYFDRALTGRNDWSWALYDLGMAYLALDRADDAVHTFGRITPIYPAMPDLYYGRGLAYFATGGYANAITDFVRSSDLVPEWAEPLLALGLTYYAQKELSEAINPYERALAIWPGWAPPYYALAEVWIDRGDLDQALRLVTLGVDRGPWRAQHHLALARKLAAKGNGVAAWRQVQIARKLGGQIPRAFLDDLRKRAPEPKDDDRWPWSPRFFGGARIEPDHPWASPEAARRSRDDEVRGRTPGMGPAGERAGRERDRGREGADRDRGREGLPPGVQGGGRGQGGGPPEQRGGDRTRDEERGGDKDRGRDDGRGRDAPGQGTDRGQGGGQNRGYGQGNVRGSDDGPRGQQGGGQRSSQARDQGGGRDQKANRGQGRSDGPDQAGSRGQGGGQGRGR